MVRLSIALLAVGLVPGRAIAAEESLVVVRTVAVHAAPPGWLASEELVFSVLGERVGSLVPASVAADLWQAPGYRWDRARERIRAALNGAEEALAKSDLKGARRHLKDVDELLELGPVVAVVPAVMLRRYHLLAARAALARGRGADAAVSKYLALTGVRVGGELDAAAVERVRAEVAEPVALTVEVKPASAVVFLDGVRISGGKVRRYDIGPGRHYLRVVAPGHEAFGERIDMAAAAVVRRAVRLSPIDDPMSVRGRALAKSRPAEREVKRLRKVVEPLGVTGALILALDDDSGMTLRYYEVGLGAWRPAVPLPFAATRAEVEQRVDQALGRAAAPPVLEAIDAAPAGLSEPGMQAMNEPIVETDDDDGLLSSRWLWAGAGVAVVVGVVVTVLVVGGSDADTGRATVWLCPQGGSLCVP